MKELIFMPTKRLEFLEILDTSFDPRQHSKVKHKLSEIIGLSLIAILGSADDCVEIAEFCNSHKNILQEYFELPHGIPSHDTFTRGLAIVEPTHLQALRDRFSELLNANEGQKLRKILSIDGKTQRGNGTKAQKANHIVSAVDDNGICITEELVDDKSNEITAIPRLLDSLNIKGHIVTIDAMGTQKEIAKNIRKKRADYVLALKGNQGSLETDVKEYFGDSYLLKKCAYHRTIEKARGSIEIREYWQTNDIAWLSQKKDWAGLSTIAMTRNTIKTRAKTLVECRYFISSLPTNVEEVARAIRGHWMIESYHWHLDVTFREDANQTLEKQAAFNLNILRKLALNILKLLDIGDKGASLKIKRRRIGWNPKKYLSALFDI